MRTAVHRGGKRKPMPSTVVEEIMGRGLSWVVVCANGLIAALLVALIPTAFRSLTTTSERFTFAAVAIGYVISTWYVAVLSAWRPRRTIDGVRSASAKEGRGVVVPGSVTASVAAMLTAIAWAVGTFSGAMVARGGWRVLLVLVAVGLAVAAVDQGFAAGQRRFLVLSPEAVEVGSFCGVARVDWDDIDSITVREGFGGHMVFRVRARDGAQSWLRLSRHPLHRARTWCDIEPLSLALDPLLLGATVLAAWEDARVRSEIGATATSTRLIDPDWAMHAAASAGPMVLLRTYRPEREPG